MYVQGGGTLEPPAAHLAQKGTFQLQVVAVQVSHDPHVTLESVGLFPLRTEGALLEDGFLTQPEKGVERVYLGVALAKLRLGEFSLVLAEPVDADEPVNDSVVIFVFDGTFNL